MKILVTFYTQTGNTQKIAEAIFDEIHSQDLKVDLKNIREVTDEALAGYQLIFLGSPCHSSDLAEPVKAFLQRVHPAPALGLAGFVTHSTYLPDGSERRGELYEAWAGRCAKTFEQVCHAKGMAWRGYFSCQGAPSKPIEAFIHSTIVTDPVEWETYVTEARKHPDAEDFAKARAFARAVLK